MRYRFLTALGAVVAFASLASAFAPAAQTPSFTADQAANGRFTYYAHCAECHGGGMQGNFGPALAGGSDRTQFETGQAVYAYYSVHMPHGNPGGLSTDEYVSVMAFLYQQHGKRPGTAPLTVRAIAADTGVLGE